MFNTKLITLTALSIASLAGYGARAKADSYAQLSRHAVDVVNKSNLLIGESNNYRQTPQYGRLMRNLHQLNGLADSIHRSARHRANVFVIDRDLQELAARFHRVRGLVRDIEHDARFGHGRIHGCTERVHRLMDSMQQCINHMQVDVRRLKSYYRPGCRDNGRHFDDRYYGGDWGRDFGHGHYDRGGNRGGNRGVNRGGVNLDRGGVTIGKGNVRFRINF